ncbi:hypothetical protein F183_A21390 [Bryobacterales bacterium F-183]|nr:hypothetical protein F183_A21390 [Bryobacterales bacterium F-183]
MESLLTKERLELGRPDEYGFNRLHEFDDRAKAFLFKLAERSGVVIDERITLEELAQLRPVDLRRYSMRWLLANLQSRFERQPILAPVELNCENGRDFEKWLQARLLAAGAHAELTKIKGDMGVDVLVRTGARTLAIQAKLYNTPVGPEAIREINAGRTHYRTSEAWAVTNSSFTAQARQEALSLSVGLIDGADLPQLAAKLSLAPATAAQPVVAQHSSPLQTSEYLSMTAVGISVLNEVIEGPKMDRRALGLVVGGILVAGFGGLSILSNSPEQELVGLVNEWRASILMQQPDAHSKKFYGKTVERFYLLRDAPQSAVASAWNTLAKQYPSIDQLDIRNIKVESISNDRASVIFDKEWRMSGKGTFEGSVQQRLVFARVVKEWRIVQEVEPTVRWSRRSK